MKRSLIAFAFLGAAFAQENRTPDVRESIEKSVALLQTSGSQFLKKSGCISCHNQSIPSMAVAAARERGYRVNEDLARQAVKATIAVASPHRETLMQGVPTVPATTIVTTYALVSLAAEGYAADETTDFIVHELAARQRPDGRWHAEGSRPPLDQGDETATALSLRSLQLYPIPGRKAEFEQRVARARTWLLSATPSTTQEKAMRLLGLAWSKADPAQVRRAAGQLIEEQRPDGGWAQLHDLESDAYATGLVMMALLESGGISASDKTMRSGSGYLLRTQQPDGSWHVKTRALGFQPYFEGGFPYGHDQWISAAGSAWATMALVRTAEPATQTARR